MAGIVVWGLLQLALGAEVRGTVTLGGEPAPWPIVSAGKVEIVGEADGSFVIDAPDGQAVRAEAYRRDADGATHHLRSDEATGATVALVLDEVERDGTWEAAPADLLAALPQVDVLTVKERDQVRAIAGQLVAAPDAAARRKIIAANEPLLRKHGGYPLDQAFSGVLMGLDQAADFPGMHRAGLALRDAGEALDLDWMRANGLVVAAVGTLTGDRALGLELIAEAEAAFDRAIAATSRAGERRTLKGWKAQAYLVHGFLAQFQEDWAELSRVTEAELGLRLETGQLRQAVRCYDMLAFAADMLDDRAGQLAWAMPGVELADRLGMEDEALQLREDAAWAMDGDEAVIAWRDLAERRAARGDAIGAALAHVAAAGVLGELGRKDEAEADLLVQLRTIEALPRSDAQQDALADAWRELADARVREEACSDGGEAARTALRIDTERGRADNYGLDHLLLGQCLDAEERYAEARAAYLASAEAWSGTASDHLVPSVLRYAASTHVYGEPADVPAALALYERSLALAREKGLEADVAEALDLMGMVYFSDEASIPELEQCAAWFEEARALFAKLGDVERARELDERIAATLDLLAFREMEAGAPERAKERLERAMEVAREAGDAARMGTVHSTFAWWHADRGEWGEALVHERAYLGWLRSPEARVDWQETWDALPPEDRESYLPLDTQIAVSLGIIETYLWNAGKLDDVWPAIREHREHLEAIGDEAGIFQSLQTELLYRVNAGNDGWRRVLADLEPRATTDDQRASLWTMQLYAALAQGDAEEALATMERAEAWLDARRDVARALPPGERQGFVMGWAMLGMLRTRLGQPRQGVVALEFAVEITERDVRLAYLGELGRAYRTLGRLQDALETQEEMLGTRRAMGAFGRPTDEILGQLELLDIQRALGDSAGAEATRARLRDLGKAGVALEQRTPTDDQLLAHVIAMDAEDALEAGRAADAVKQYELAFALYGDYRDDRVLRSRVRWLEARHRAGPAAAAPPKKRKKQAAAAKVDYAAEWRALVGELARPDAGPALIAAVDLADPLGIGTVDRRWLATELRVAELGAEREGLLHALPGLRGARARLLASVGDDEEAVAAYRAAIDDLDLLRTSLRSDASKVGFLDAAEGRLYDEAVALLVRLGRPEEALEVSERSRARAFQDLLATAEVEEALRADPTAAAALALVERVDALGAGEKQLSLASFLPEGVGSVAAGGREVRASGLDTVDLPLGDPAQAVAQLREARAKAGGDEVVSVITARAITAADARTVAASAGGTIVEYHVTAEATYGFVVTPDAVRVVTLPVALTDLEEAITAARASMGVELGRGVKVATSASAKPVSRGDEALTTLHDALVAPLGDLGAGPVTVVPHGPLFLVPFAALPDDEGRPLVERHALLSAPAIGVLAFTERKRARVAESGALIVGNPTMPTLPTYSLPPLPGAEREARQVAALWKTDVLSGDAATEAAVVQGVQGARVVHLATHGVVDDDDPLASFVALAPGSGGDGLLTVEEVFALRLRADLVALSACQTGLGRISGDGVMGLGRAFLFAGTPSVLVSLWSVSDEATAHAMGVFYERLAAGATKAEALRDAQLATRGVYPNEAEWAAFVLVGSN